MTHYGYAEIVQLAAAEKEVTAEELIKTFFDYKLTLERGDTSYAPGTTKKFFGGPGEIMYGFYPDGSTKALTIEGTHITHKISE